MHDRGNRADGDQAMFKGEGRTIGTVKAGQIKQPPVEDRFVRHRCPRASCLSVDRPVLVGFAATTHQIDDIGNVEYRRMDARRRHEGSGTFAAIDQPGFCQRRDRLADGSTRAGIFSRQFVLEGNPVPLCPATAADVALNIGANATVKCGGCYASACSRRMVRA